MASGSLSGAEDIGGAVVSIGGDISDLRASVAEAKNLRDQFLGQIWEIKPKIATAEVAAQAAQAMNATRGLVSTRPLEVKIDHRALTAEFAKLNASLTAALGKLQTEADARPIQIRTQEDTGPVGRGNFLNRNPFSARGLGPMVGGLAIAATGMEVLRVVSEIAQNSAEHTLAPSRILEAHNTTGRDITQDAFAVRQANAQADAEFGTKNLQSLEGVPLLGSFVRLVDAADGLSAAYQRETEVAQRAIESHQKAVAAIDETNVQAEATAGNPIRAAAMAASIKQSQMTAEINADTRNGIVDPAKIKARSKFNALTNYQLQGMQDQHDRNLREVMAGGLEAQATGGNDSKRALQIRQTEQYAEFKRDRDKAIRDAGPKDQGTVIDEYQKRDTAMQQKQAAERVEIERKTQNEITQVMATGRAANAKALHYDLNAKLIEFDAQTQIAVRNADTSTVKSVEDSRTQQRAAIIHEDKESADDHLAAASDSAAVSALRTGRYNFQAGILQSTRSEERRIAHEDNRFQAADTVALRANVQYQVAEHVREIGLDKTSLEARQQAAEARIGNKPITAQIIEANAKAEREVAEASPELRQATLKTALAELDAQRHDLFGWHGGGVATAVGKHEFYGELPEQINDRAIAKKKSDDERNNLAKQIGKPDSAEKGNTLLDQIRGLMKDLLDKYDAHGLAS